MFSFLAARNLVKTNKKVTDKGKGKEKKNSTPFFDRLFHISKTTFVIGSAGCQATSASTQSLCQVPSCRRSNHATSPLELNPKPEVEANSEPPKEPTEAATDAATFVDKMRANVASQEKLRRFSESSSILSTSDECASQCSENSEPVASTLINNLPFGEDFLDPTPNKMSSTFVDNQIDALIAANPNLSTDLNLLKQSIIKHENEVTEARNAYDMKLSRMYWIEKQHRKAKEKQLAVKHDLMRGAVAKFEEFEAKLTAASKYRTRLQEHIFMLEGDCAALTSNEDNLERILETLKSENRHLDYVVHDLERQLNLGDNPLRKAGNDHHATEQKNQNLAPAPDAMRSHHDGKDLAQEVEFLAMELGKATTKITDLEDVVEMRDDHLDRLQHEYKFHYSYFSRMEQLNKDYFHENDLPAAYDGMAGLPTCNSLARLSDGQADAWRASLLKYAAAIMEEHYRLMPRNEAVADLPIPGQQFLDWIRHHCADKSMIDKRSQQYGKKDVNNEDSSKAVVFNSVPGLSS